MWSEIRHINAGTLNFRRILNGLFALSCVCMHATAVVSYAEDLPQRVIWVWEVDTDLAGVSLGDTGVAFLAATVESSLGNLRTRYRLAELRFPNEKTPRMPVIRIHSPPASLEKRFPEVIAKVKAVAKRVLSDFPFHRLQIDFDARTSEREGYAMLLRELRRDICPEESCFLSITALHSWCLSGENWLAELPVDEIVPMMFTGGRTASTRESSALSETLSARCRSAEGVLFPFVTDATNKRREYIFNAAGWRSSDVGKLGWDK